MTAKGFKSAGVATSTVQQDDTQASIARWDFEPGAATGWHTHAWPYLVVMLTDGVMMVHDGENVTRFDRKAGESYIRPAGIKHDVMNGGKDLMAFVEIEIKRADVLRFSTAAEPAG